MKKVLWYSRHYPIDAQVRDLNRIFGEDVDIVHISSTASCWQDVITPAKENGCVAIVAVLPIPLLAQVVNRCNNPDIPVIRASMRRTLDSNGGSLYTYDHFERVVNIVVETEELSEGSMV